MGAAFVRQREHRGGRGPSRRAPARTEGASAGHAPSLRRSLVLEALGAVCRAQRAQLLGRLGGDHHGAGVLAAGKWGKGGPAVASRERTPSSIPGVGSQVTSWWCSCPQPQGRHLRAHGGRPHLMSLPCSLASLSSSPLIQWYVTRSPSCT